MSIAMLNEWGLLVGKTVTIKPGYGYWDCTSYPIGGCFRRAPAGGLSFKVARVFEFYKGANLAGRAEDGREIACGNDTLMSAE